PRTAPARARPRMGSRAPPSGRPPPPGRLRARGRTAPPQPPRPLRRGRRGRATPRARRRAGRATDRAQARAARPSPRPRHPPARVELETRAVREEVQTVELEAALAAIGVSCLQVPPGFGAPTRLERDRRERQERGCRTDGKAFANGPLEVALQHRTVSAARC